MKQLRYWLPLLFCLALGHPAQAQFNPVFYPWLYSGAAYHQHGCCCCCCHPRDTTTLTERTNRVVWIIGPTLLLGPDSRVRGGGFMELGAAVGPRLTVTGHLMISGDRASTDNFGTDATALAYSLQALTGRARYQLFNGHRWRVEALAGLGLGAVWLVDRDQLVYYNTGRSSGYRPATVTYQVHPLTVVGLSTSWKVGREFWLTSQATYTQPALSGGVGSANDFAYWNLSVGATIPWGYLGHKK